LEAANEQAVNQANDTTGLRELAARISSSLSTGGFPEVEIDDSERPRKVRYISEAQKEERIEEELEADRRGFTGAVKRCIEKAIEKVREVAQRVMQSHSRGPSMMK